MMLRFRVLLLILLYLTLGLAIYVIIGINSYESSTGQPLVVTGETTYHTYPEQSLILITSMVLAVMMTTWSQIDRIRMRPLGRGMSQIVVLSITFLVVMFGLLVIGLYALPFDLLLLILNLPMGGTTP